MVVNKEKIRYILQFFFDKGKNASQAGEIVHGVYGADTAKANYVLFGFRRFHSGIFDVKDASRTGKHVVENVDKITEIIEVDWHVSSRSITQKLKINHKTVLNHLRKVRFKKKLDVWVPHQLTPKNMMDRISICETLTKRNEFDPFLKRIVTEDEKWVTYDSIVRKRSWSKCREIAQTVKPGLTARKFGLAIHQNDHKARRRFVERAQNEIAVVPDFHKRILFSDEAHFWLNGYVNKQNCRIWSEANPQVYVETPLHPDKLTVWCALWAGGILLQKR
ncbi:histone-lysine N-methyltransferase SETMAR [Trichonephila clavipes]|nr:histone-lysine N-methyltransferase SETMAR [Trichonephila clavipes]